MTQSERYGEFYFLGLLSSFWTNAWAHFDIVVEECSLTHKRKITSGKNDLVRSQDAGGIIPNNQVCTPSWVSKEQEAHKKS